MSITGKDIKKRSKGRVTLKDVAQATGVSSITVSRVINSPEKVTKELRDRIQQAITELGYIPNLAAKALATNRTNNIAVVIPSISNAVFTSVLSGMYDLLTPANYDIVLANTNYSIQQENQLISKLLAQHPDGIIVTGLDLSEQSVSLLKSANIPVVQILEVGTPDKVIDMNVGISHFDAGYAMGEYLASKGYQKIGFVGAQMDIRAQRRMQGFLSALDDAELENDKYIVTTQKPSDVALGGQLLSDLLAQYPDVEAVFFVNDDLAYGGIYECQRRFIKVPKQLAIAGFNDLASSESINPSLTTIHVPLYEMGKLSAEMILQRLNKQEVENSCLDLGFQLKKRQSS